MKTEVAAHQSVRSCKPLCWILAGILISSVASSQVPGLAYLEELGSALEPAWVSLDAAIDEPELLGAEGLDSLQYLSERTLDEGECLIRASDGNLGGMDVSFEHAVNEARWIFEAEVEEAVPGLLFGHKVGTILRLRISREQKVSEVPEESGEARQYFPEIYYFYPSINTTFQGKAICKHEARFPRLPRVGERILVLTPLAAPQDGPWHALTDHDVIVIDAAKQEGNRTSYFKQDTGTEEKLYDEVVASIAALTQQRDSR